MNKVYPLYPTPLYEERIEERLIHAHERGYYEDVMKKIKSLEMLHPKMDR